MAFKKNKDGRDFTIRTKDEVQKALKADWDNLSDHEKKLARQALDQLKQQGKSPEIEVARKFEYDREPVSVREFFTNPYYIGDFAKKIFPKRVEDLCEIFDGEFHEVILSGAIGWGKSVTGVLIMLRMVYEALCLADPQESYGLPAGSQIHFVNLSIKVELARKVLFENIGERLYGSQFFKDIGFTMTKDEIRFPKGITIAAGTSSASGVLGLHVFGAIMDEADFYADVRGGNKKERVGGMVKDRAETIYNQILRRMKSRFMDAGKLPGLLVILSSKRETTDFTERRLKQARAKEDPKVFYREYALWDVNRSDYSKKVFKVLVGNEVTRSRILTLAEALMQAPEGTRVIEVPEDFRDDFENDCDGAIRDFAGIATAAIEPFIPMRERLALMVDRGFVHPFPSEQWTPGTPLRFDWTKIIKQDEKGRAEAICCPDASRHVHIDPSLSRLPTGFAVGHICGTKPVRRREEPVEGSTPLVITTEVPVVRFDVLLQIIPPQGEEIVLAEVCGLVTLLYRRGLPIRSVSMDKFQSAGPLQDLAKEGFECSRLSVEDPQPYLNLKEAIYEERVRIYQYEVVLTELRSLEWDHVRHKVIKPANGTKDVADAVAGVVHKLTQSPTHAPIAPMLGMSVLPAAPDETGAVYLPGGNILWDDEMAPSTEVDDEGESLDLPFFLG